MSFFAELKRRNVFRVAAAYAVVAWLLIEISDTIFPRLGLPEWTVTFVIALLLLGFPVALFFAWAYELTPEGLKREQDVDRSESITPHTGKKLDRAIMVVLALGLAFFAFDKFVLYPQRDAALKATLSADTAVAVEEAREAGRSEAVTAAEDNRSIAVLAFADMSPEGDQEYLSDGIAEELLNLLAKIPELRVISRSSAFSYKGKDIKLAQVAEELNVAHILEGSVRKAGNRVRITAQLIDARSDTHMWSETYERQLEDVFAIQDEISAAIVESLRGTINLDVDEAPSSTAVVNLEAHDAYLRGRYLLAKRNVEGAVREFEKAISIEPDYALAHAQLAIAYQLGYLRITITESMAKAAPHAEKAMALDPSLAEAHAAAGFFSWTMEESKEALRHLEQAVRINPNYADVYNWMAQILDWSLGRYSEAFAMRQKAVQLDPLSVPALRNYAASLIARGRFAEAERELEKLASLAPGVAVQGRVDRTWYEGLWAESALGLLDIMRSNSESPGGRSPALIFAFALMGLEKEALAVEENADRWLLSLLGRSKEAVIAAQADLREDPLNVRRQVAVGLALAGAGDYDGARPYLEEAWQKWGRVIMGGSFNVNHATALVAARRADGEADNVADLLAAIRDNVRRYEEAGISALGIGSPIYFENGLVSYLEGDKQRGLELIALAVENGYFIPPNQAYLQELYEHPGFGAIREMQEARQARERNKFLAVVCVDNPYEKIWQPAEGTCEQFTVEQGN
jgi:TolB-like protein/Tfp pilus assembly protein PilF